MRIKKDDTVIVLTGKDKGKTGKVLKAMPKDGKVIVEGVNIQTKHQKQTQKEAAEIAFNTVKKYFKENNKIRKVVFNVFESSDYQIYRQLLGADK